MEFAIYPYRVRYIYDTICPAGREGIYIISQSKIISHLQNISRERSEHLAERVLLWIIKQLKNWQLN